MGLSDFVQFWGVDFEYRCSFAGRGAVLEIWGQMPPKLNENMLLLKLSIYLFKSLFLVIGHCLWPHQAHRRYYLGFRS